MSGVVVFVATTEKGPQVWTLVVPEAVSYQDAVVEFLGTPMLVVILA